MERIREEIKAIIVLKGRYEYRDSTQGRQHLRRMARAGVPVKTKDNIVNETEADSQLLSREETNISHLNLKQLEEERYSDNALSLLFLKAQQNWMEMQLKVKMIVQKQRTRQRPTKTKQLRRWTKTRVRQMKMRRRKAKIRQ